MTHTALLTWCVFVSFALTAGSTPTGQSTCHVLQSSLPGRVTFPGDTTYNLSIASYAYTQEQSQTPSCIVQPVSTEEVSSAIKILRKSMSSFAVKSGGHATNKGFSNIDHGVTVDLTRLNNVSYDQSNLIVSIGTGAYWSEVYPVLDSFNRSLNGGRASGVGAGGFLTGGGIGFFALEYGFACDAVVNMEVVLSNGQVVSASTTKNLRLFRALKGGQSNFGIVTRFDILTIPKGVFWGGTVVFPENTTADQLTAFTQWKTVENFDPHSSVEQSHVFTGLTKSFLVASSVFYTLPIPFPHNLKNLTNIQPQTFNTLRISNATDFSNEVQSFSTPNQNTIFVTTTFRNSPSILSTVHQIWRSAISNLTSSTTFTSSLTFQSVPAAPSSPKRENSLGFGLSSTPQKDLVLVLLTNFWEDETIANKAIDSARTFIRYVELEAARQGIAQQFQYPNYAGAGFQQPLLSTGKLEFFRDVARQYDPIRMFQDQAIGGWKL